MGEPLIITIDANVAPGLSKIQQALSQTGDGLNKLHETSMLAREGFHQLESASVLLAGQRFPQLAEGIIGLRAALGGINSAARLTGLSMATLGVATGGVLAIIAGAALVWKHYSDQAAAAADQTEKMKDGLREVPKLLEDIDRMVATGRMQPGTAKEFRQYLTGQIPLYKDAQGNITRSPQEIETTPTEISPEGEVLHIAHTSTKQNTPASVKEVNDYVQGLMGVDQVKSESVKKLQDLEEQQRQESLQGIDKEIAEIKKKFTAARQELSTTFNAANDASGGRGLSSKEIAAYKASQAQLDANEAEAIRDAQFKKQKEDQEAAAKAAADGDKMYAEQSADAREQLEKRISQLEEDQVRYRGHLWQEEYDMRVDLLTRQLLAAEITQKQYDQLLAEAQRKRDQGQREGQQLAIESAARAQAIELDSLRLDQERIEKDPYKSRAEKIRELLPVLQQYQQIEQQQLNQVNSQLANPNLSDEQKNALLEQRLRIMREMLEIQMQMKEQQGSQTFAGTFQTGFANLQNSLGSMGSNIATTGINAMKLGIQGIGDAVTDVIENSRRLKEVSIDVARQIVSQAIHGIINGLMQWTMQFITQSAVQLGIHTTTQTAMTTTALTQSKARAAAAIGEAMAYDAVAAMEGAAAVADIPYVGPYLAIAAMASIFGEGMGIIGGASSGMAFESGGYTGDGGRNEPAGVVHRGEYVFNSARVREIGLPFLESMHRGASYSSIGPALSGDSASDAGRGGVNLHFYDRRPHPRDYLNSSAGRNHIVEIVRNERLSIGIPT